MSVPLFCWHHNAVHRLTHGQVERVVYALTGALADVTVEPLPQFVGEDSHEHLVCPEMVLRSYLDVEMYGEHVEQGVECRRASEAST